MLAVAGRGALLLVVAVWSVPFLTRPLGTAASDSFLHLVNLPFHEAGHILFMPFGGFMMSLGGSLMQLLVPVVCGGALLWQNRDPFGASLALWWLGENFMDLAPYIADARTLDLVLLGGVTGREVEGHDWEAILTTVGWLQYDRTLARASHVVGAVLMIAALVCAAVIVVIQAKAVSAKADFPR